MPVQEHTPCTEASGKARVKGSPAVLVSDRMACGGGGGGLGGKKAASTGAVWDALSLVWIVIPPLIVTTGSTCTCHQHERSILGLMQPDKEAHKQHAHALGMETTTTSLKMWRNGHILTCILINERHPCYTTNHVLGPSVPSRKGEQLLGNHCSCKTHKLTSTLTRGPSCTVVTSPKSPDTLSVPGPGAGAGAGAVMVPSERLNECTLALSLWAICMCCTRLFSSLGSKPMMPLGGLPGLP